MREMKDSGIEWIADIPEHWSVSKIGGLYSLRMTKVSDRDYPPLSVTNKGILPQLETAAKTNAHDDRKLVCKGDFAINSRSDRRGSCGISSYTGSVSLINTILHPMTEMHPQYYDWLFHTIQFGDEFYKWGHGIVDDLWTTGWQDMKKISIPTPPITEQAVIADFLDEQCAEIDTLVTDIQSQIEALEEYKRSVITEVVTKGLDPDVEMRDSGIAWVGDIPAHWLVEKVKFHLQRNEPRNPGDKQVLSVYREYGVIPKDSRDDNHNVTSEDTSNYKYVVPGNLVINKMKAWQGSMGVSEYEGIVSPAYFIYKFTDNQIMPKYLHYLFRSCYKDEFRRISGGIREGQWDLSPYEFSNTLLLIPPTDEQNRIVSYIDARISEIEFAITEKKQQIETIEEYKKSLIFEYVTGKKEVQA
ncbi:restriction endonuclease subunit S [Ruminococcus sp. AF25-19]|nr:restriction endonuclease subunit S [Ruminococcus sp. AF25-19]